MATYVFGITAAGVGQLPAMPGFEPRNGLIRTVEWGSLAAVVATLGEPLQATARTLKAHAKVLEAVAAERTVLPLRFGTVVDDDVQVVLGVLQPRAAHLQSLLERFEGHVELNVKVFDDEERLLREILASDRTVARLQAKLQGVDKAASYYDRIQLGDRVMQQVQQRRQEQAEQLVEQLGPLAADVRVNEPALDRMVFDGAFLVARDQLATFDDRVNDIARDHPDWDVRYLGPMPAYSFAETEV